MMTKRSQSPLKVSILTERNCGRLLCEVIVGPGLWDPDCGTRIVGKGRLWVTSFIYKYKTSTAYPLYETTRCFVPINK